MHYFVTSRIDRLTSAIELAEIKRIQLFDKLQIPAKIVTRLFDSNQESIWQELGIAGRVINMQDYFQRLLPNQTETAELIKQLFSTNNLNQQGLKGFKAQKLRLEVQLQGQLINYVTYFDRWGFTDRRDFYYRNQISYSEFYDDGGKLITRTYYNNIGQAILMYHYRGGPENQPIMTLIQLFHRNHWFQFDQEDQLMAYFLDCLAVNDSDASFYSDREDYAVRPFKLMKKSAKRYVIFHSIFTEDAKASGNLFPFTKEVFQLGKKLNGIICSTQQEKRDIEARFKDAPCYAIPVSYLPNELLKQKTAFAKRVPGQIIAVARLTSVKRLDVLIEAVALIHKKLKFVDLKIYGYDDSWNNYEESTKLHKLVEQRNASTYVHFCGYQADLTSIYQAADLEVLTSNYEGFSMAILESLGHGCPVVSYDINYGPNEMVQDHLNGRLLPAGDFGKLYRTLFDLLSHREKLRFYSQNAPESMYPYQADQVQKVWGNFIVKEKNKIEV
ncbi:glycosyltransferase [Liquorilactobacillus nagelii]|uniref:glycosyltransferase n=1 Tax=Liquorilactobacillus nagelii TaxID=82688 RepID=UPI0039E7D1F2